MTPAFIAGGAVLVVLLAIVLAVWVTRRSSRAADQRLTGVVADFNAQMESIVRELASALERAQDEGRKSRYLGELAASIDLDEVLARVLEAATALSHADGALISVDSVAGGKPLIATIGLSTEEAERHAVAGPPRGRRARAAIAYEYTAEELERNGELIHAGVAVRIPGDVEPVGLLAVFTRTPGQQFGDEETRELEELAVQAGPAIENARRFREARQLADMDALTGLHNRRFFHETLAREVARAQRYGRRLALIVLDLDDFKAVNDRIGHLAGDDVLSELGDRMREVVRSADVACRIGGEEFAVVLPESTLDDAEQLYERLLRAVSSRPFGEAGRLSLSGGITELHADDDKTSFFERADEALYRAKSSGKSRSVSADGGSPPEPRV